MRRGWWASEILAIGRVLGSRSRTAITQARAIRNQLGADDHNIAWGVDAQPYLASLQADNGDANVITDEEFFHELPGKHEHF